MKRMKMAKIEHLKQNVRKICIKITIAVFLFLTIIQSSYSQPSSVPNPFSNVIFRATEYARTEIPERYNEEPILNWGIEDRRSTGRNAEEMISVNEALKLRFQEIGHDPITDDRGEDKIFKSQYTDAFKGNCDRVFFNNVKSNFFCELLLYGYIVESPIGNTPVIVLKLLDLETMELIWGWVGDVNSKRPLVPGYKTGLKEKLAFISELTTNYKNGINNLSYEEYIFLKDYISILFTRLSRLSFLDQQPVINETASRSNTKNIEVAKRKYDITEDILDIKTDIINLKSSFSGSDISLILVKELDPKRKIKWGRKYILSGESTKNVEFFFIDKLASILDTILVEYNIPLPTTIVLNKLNFKNETDLPNGREFFKRLLQYQIVLKNNNIGLIDCSFIERKFRSISLDNEYTMNELRSLHGVKYIIDITGIELGFPLIKRVASKWKMVLTFNAVFDIYNISTNDVRIISNDKVDELLTIDEENEIQQYIDKYVNSLILEINAQCESYLDTGRLPDLFRFLDSVERNRIDFFRRFSPDSYNRILEVIKVWRKKIEEG